MLSAHGFGQRVQSVEALGFMVRKERCMNGLHILLVDSSVYTLDLMRRRMKLWSLHVILDRVSTEEAILRLIGGKHCNLVILGNDPLVPDALEILSLRNRMRLKVPVIALTDEYSTKTAMLLAGNGLNGFVKWQEIQKLQTLVTTLVIDQMWTE